jgi:hypothetical protein
MCASLIFIVGTAHAQAQLAPNQTNGFGNGRLVTFTYLQNFDCVDQPALDRTSMELKRNPIRAKCKHPYARW